MNSVVCSGPVTGCPVDRVERRTGTGEMLLSDTLVDEYDTVIFDSKRSHQAITYPETEAVQGFLARPGTTLFVSALIMTSATQTTYRATSP
jgi:hypothetical protein